MHFLAALSTTFAVAAIIFHISSSSILTDWPHEMTLAKTSGTLETVNISRSKDGSYDAGLKMTDGDGTTRRFGTFNIHQIHNGVAKFRSLRPGDQLNIIYRADRRGRPLQPRAAARIMAMWANGHQIVSLAESAAISTFLKKDRKSIALYCTVAAICSLILAVFLGLRKQMRPNPAQSGAQSDETSLR